MSSPWEDLVTTATLGTDRRPLDVSGWPGRVGELARALPTSGPALLLDAAALSTAYRRAGGSPPPAAVRPAPPAPGPARPEVPPAAAARLRDLLLGGRPALLPEWLALAAAAGRRAPADTVPALLDLAAGRSELAAPVAAVLDLPGAWLAGFRPEWTRAVAGATAVLDGPPPHQWWTHGSTAERLAWLRATREGDPDAARTAVEQVWAREPADDRVRLLAALAPTLGPADEDLLERALDDRGAAVRRQAAALLARLPGSAFVGRWRERLAGSVRVERTLLRPARLRVDAGGPEVPERDLALAVPRGAGPRATGPAVPAGPGAGAVGAGAVGAGAVGAGAVGAGFLGAAPAACWDAVADAAALVALPVAGVDRGALLATWAFAAERDGHLPLARALLDAGLVSGGLLAVLPQDERGSRALQLVDADPGSAAGVVALRACPAPWSGGLAAAAIGLAGRVRSDPAGGPRVRELLDLVAHRADARRQGPRVALRQLVEQLPATSTLLPSAHAALATLTTRMQMDAEMHTGTAPHDAATAPHDPATAPADGGDR